MTEIRCERRGDVYRVSLTGHAGYAKDGEPDIVCAAVSTLACTLLQCLGDLRADGAVETLSYRQEAGDVRLFARASPEAAERVRAVVDTAMTGFAMVAEGYPGHVRVNGMPCET